MTSYSLAGLNSLTWPYSRLIVRLLDRCPVRALYGQVGERVADKIVFSMAELTGNIWMMENISE